MNTIKFQIFALSFTFLVISCKPTAKTQVDFPSIENPEILILNHIQCLNMAEKLIGIGTKNDEILLLVFHLNHKNEAQLIASTDFLIFEKEDSIGQSLNLSISVDGRKNPKELKFLLLEMDTDRTKNELSQLTENLLNLDLKPERLKEKLREDDLLGIKTLSTSKTSKKGKLKFSGMHLFDKYHYEISYEFK